MQPQNRKRRIPHAREMLPDMFADEPKKPGQGPFGCYWRSQRQEIKKGLPVGSKITEVAKKGSQIWRNMTEIEKKPYEEEYQELLRKYREDVVKYWASRGYHGSIPSKSRRLRSLAAKELIEQVYGLERRTDSRLDGLAAQLREIREQMDKILEIFGEVQSSVDVQEIRNPDESAETTPAQAVATGRLRKKRRRAGECGNSETRMHDLSKNLRSPMIDDCEGAKSPKEYSFEERRWKWYQSMEQVPAQDPLRLGEAPESNTETAPCADEQDPLRHGEALESNTEPAPFADEQEDRLRTIDPPNGGEPEDKAAGALELSRQSKRGEMQAWCQARGLPISGAREQLWKRILKAQEREFDRTTEKHTASNEDTSDSVGHGKVCRVFQTVQCPVAVSWSFKNEKMVRQEEEENFSSKAVRDDSPSPHRPRRRFRVKNDQHALQSGSSCSLRDPSHGQESLSGANVLPDIDDVLPALDS